MRHEKSLGYYRRILQERRKGKRWHWLKVFEEEKEGWRGRGMRVVKLRREEVEFLKGVWGGREKVERWGELGPRLGDIIIRYERVYEAANHTRCSYFEPGPIPLVIQFNVYARQYLNFQISTIIALYWYNVTI